MLTWLYEYGCVEQVCHDYIERYGVWQKKIIKERVKYVNYQCLNFCIS
jgi:hypothetical protein